MKEFLKENGFERILRKNMIMRRDNSISEIHYNPYSDVFITKNRNGEIRVGKFGSGSLECVDHWRRKLDIFLAKKNR